MKFSSQMNSKKKIVFLAGHNGMVGKALLKNLQRQENIEILTVDKKKLDLRNQEKVNNFFQINKIDEVYLAAAKVGGINSNNSYPADFLYQNLLIELNVIEAAHRNGIEKLLFLGSSCIYPRDCKQPIKESYLLSGYLEATNESYAVAKIAGLKFCESLNRQFGLDYRSVMPTNLYGPYDNFNLENAHVIPALLRKIHEAKENKHEDVVIWGSGKPKREFLYVSEMAEASMHIMNLDKSVFENLNSKCSHINVGSGKDLSILETAKLIAKVVGYQGKFTFDKSYEDGTPKKLLDVSLINSLGWYSKISLEDGLTKTYEWFKENINSLKK